jgi:hypothetical protein
MQTPENLGSIVIPFRHRDEGGPTAIVIGSGHAPYYVFEDGHTETVSPQIAAASGDRPS